MVCQQRYLGQHRSGYRPGYRLGFQYTGLQTGLTSGNYRLYSDCHQFRWLQYIRRHGNRGLGSRSVEGTGGDGGLVEFRLENLERHRRIRAPGSGGRRTLSIRRVVPTRAAMRATARTAASRPIRRSPSTTARRTTTRRCSTRSSSRRPRRRRSTTESACSASG